MRSISVLLFLSFFCCIWELKGQRSFLSPDEIITQTGAYLSTSSRTPYLNRIQRYGLVPVEAQTLFFNAALHHKYDSAQIHKQKLAPWGYSYGIEAQANLGSRNSLLIPVAHISGRYRGIELYVGRKREYFGLADTTGTWGSYIWSGNALPLPKVQISTPNYISLAGKGFLSTKLGFSHGWFGKQEFTEKYYLHQKWLYIKFGRESQKLNFIGGVNQNVQWGGYSEVLKDNAYASRNGHFASDGFAYLNVVLPFKFWKRPKNRYSPYEMQYRFGNHLGTVDLGFHLKTGKETLSIYRQTPWEDGQVPEVFFSWDGNYTLVYKLNNTRHIRKVGVEFLNTQRQAYDLSRLARFIGLKERHPGEIQSYMNHGQYREGWSYQSKGLGSPAIIPHAELSEENQIGDYSRFTYDNKVIATAFNIEGIIGKINYVAHSGYILSSGLLRAEREEKFGQFSMRVTGSFPIPKSRLYGKIDLGWDKGKLYGNQTGVNLVIIKQWK